MRIFAFEVRYAIHSSFVIFSVRDFNIFAQLASILLKQVDFLVQLIYNYSVITKSNFSTISMSFQLILDTLFSGNYNFP